VGLFTHTLGVRPGSGSRALWPPFLLYTACPTALDISLSCILLWFLIQTKKRVFAEQKRQRISRLITIVWQSAVPPTLCSVSLSTTYIVSKRVHPGQRNLWYPTLLEMIGKLYILSLLYNLNTRILFGGEIPAGTTYTLTVPTIVETSITGPNMHEVRQSLRQFIAPQPGDEEAA